MIPLVAIGAAQSVLLEAAGAAFEAGRPAHRSDPHAALAAVAVPVRHRGDVVAGLAVAGALGHGRLESANLVPLADCAALALAARPAASLLRGAGATAAADGPAGGMALAEALAAVAAASTSTDGLVGAALDVAAGCFGARAGFVCLPTGPGGVEVADWRGLDRHRLEAASRHPGFTRLVSGADVTVVAPTDPVVAQLTAGAEVAVTLPFAGDEPGALVLLVPEEPDSAGRQALGALRAQVAAGFRAARTTAAVEAARTQLATMIHALPEPAVAVDPDGRFRAVNAAAAELFALSDSFELGRSARGRLGHPGLEGLLFGDDGDDAFGDGSEVVLGRPTPRRFVASARSLKGAGRVLFLRPASPAGTGGRETDAVAAGLARALRAPLTAITALASGGSATAGLSTSGDWDVARQAILAETARLEAVADQLALLGEPAPDGSEGAARITVRKELCDVVAVAGAAFETHRTAAAGRDVRVTGPSRLNVIADGRLLERILDPLIDNALRYSEGPVTIEVADRGETFEVAVIDGGPGIFSGDIPGLFERYHPMDGSPVRQGAGISLYTCRRLVELLGGRIWCDSRLGIGSRFAVRLPHSPPVR
ncbi:MAG TPA: ATP-binding protein [Acidimicrobiia bacterium]|nr:ATP-binding protein [Acidimicrobiia bacterium]